VGSGDRGARAAPTSLCHSRDSRQHPSRPRKALHEHPIRGGHHRDHHPPGQRWPSEEPAVLQVVFDDDVGDGVEDKLHVLGVGGAGEVGVDLLGVLPLVQVLKLALDVASCLVVRVGPWEEEMLGCLVAARGCRHPPVTGTKGVWAWFGSPRCPDAQWMLHRHDEPQLNPAGLLPLVVCPPPPPSPIPGANTTTPHLLPQHMAPRAQQSHHLHPQHLLLHHPERLCPLLLAGGHREPGGTCVLGEADGQGAVHDLLLEEVLLVEEEDDGRVREPLVVADAVEQLHALVHPVLAGKMAA